MNAGQGEPILQRSLPFTPWDDPALSRMSGLKPVVGHWARVDEAYGGQMAKRVRFLATRRATVAQVLPAGRAAVAELRDCVLADLPDGFTRTGEWVTCPDGRDVAATGDPVETLGRLLQEDLLVLSPEGGAHVLVAGVLCFPASWTLAEKIGRPLGRIHRPVARYDAALAARVEALFHRVPAGRAMWRANALGYARADLHQPRSEADPRDEAAPARYLRCERQTILRLPRTRAVVFAVHTYVLRPEALTADQRASCPLRFEGQDAAKCFDSFRP